MYNNGCYWFFDLSATQKPGAFLSDTTKGATSFDVQNRNSTARIMVGPTLQNALRVCNVDLLCWLEPNG